MNLINKITETSRQMKIKGEQEEEPKMCFSLLFFNYNCWLEWK